MTAQGPTHRIVIGIDGSAAADRALAWGLDEAQRRQAEAHLVAVYSLPMVTSVGHIGGYVGPALTADEIRDLQASHQQVLDERVERARVTHPTVTVTSALYQGAPAAVLLEQAETADLLIVGTRGAGAFEHLLLGSVSHTLAHRAPCPVMLVPATAGAGGPARVIVGVDGSDSSDAAVDWAVAEAIICDVDLVVLHAWTHPYRGEGDEAHRQMERDAARVLDAALHRAKQHETADLAVHGLLSELGPVDALCETAADNDLLVVGARGRGAFRAALLGSTSTSVIHHAVCPVVVIRRR